jgi:NTE family protein
LIDSIKSTIKSTRSIAETETRRKNFNEKKPSLEFNTVTIDGLKSNHAKYFRQNLSTDSKAYQLDKITPKYFKLATNQKIRSIYPSSIYNRESGMFELNLDVKKEKSFKTSFGGVIASKPFSTAFFELDYHLLNTTGLKASGNIYFGSFYEAAEARLRWDIPFDIPFYLESQFTVNRYDFFNGRSAFIEEDDPSFIITSERYWESKLVLPILTKGKLAIGVSYMWQELQYYQDDDFERGDTADFSEFEGFSTFAQYSRNSLNQKMYATKGSKFELKFRSIEGRERTQPGSRSPLNQFFQKIIGG